MAAAAGAPPLLDSTAVRASVRLDLQAIRAALAPTLEAPGLWAPASATRAAVALVLREPGEETTGRSAPSSAELLLIRRAEQPGDPWSGHMALPGGRCDPTDVNVLSTAQRETHEEVGLSLEQRGLPIGRLPAVPAIAGGRPVGLTVIPLVFQITGPVELCFNYEVAEALWVPLGDLQSGALNTYIEYPLRDSKVRVAPPDPLLLGKGAKPLGIPTRLPAWAIGDRIVWGLTHRMISTLFDLLVQNVTPADAASR